MQYRKKPVVVDALQLKDDDYSIFRVLKFIGAVGEVDMNNPFERDSMDDYIKKIREEGLMINTAKGNIHASIGDYVIKGVHGEFYPCKSDIFEQTYELIYFRTNL